MGCKFHSGATPLFSLRAVSQASSQSYRSIDADAWCKMTLVASVTASCAFDCVPKTLPSTLPL